MIRFKSSCFSKHPKTHTNATSHNNFTGDEGASKENYGDVDVECGPITVCHFLIIDFFVILKSLDDWIFLDLFKSNLKSNIKFLQE